MRGKRGENQVITYVFVTYSKTASNPTKLVPEQSKAVSESSRQYVQAHHQRNAEQCLRNMWSPEYSILSTLRGPTGDPPRIPVHSPEAHGGPAQDLVGRQVLPAVLPPAVIHLARLHASGLLAKELAMG